jgi:peroxiredoxin
MSLYNEVLPEFRRFHAVLAGISVDGAWCHAAFARDRKLHFPLLSDFEPKGDVARTYGVYRHQDGICERALFVIDRMEQLPGATCLLLGSIPAPTASWQPWKRSLQSRRQPSP